MSHGDEHHPDARRTPPQSTSAASPEPGQSEAAREAASRPPDSAPNEILRDRLDHARTLIEHVEAAVAPAYRVAVFTELFRHAGQHPGAARGPHPAGAHPVERHSAAPGSVDPEAVAWAGVDLGPYLSALEGPGRLLVKALTTLAVVRDQLEVEWMTPAEIERFLVERVRARHVYRTNLSNVLRAARGLVDRRRRGRAYEYRLTEAGDAQVRREAALRPPAPTA